MDPNGSPPIAASELKHVEDAKGLTSEQKEDAQKLAKQLSQAVEYAPLWVRLLSALCLGIGTMIGYRRIVKTLGERLGNIHLTPAPGRLRGGGIGGADRYCGIYQPTSIA